MSVREAFSILLAGGLLVFTVVFSCLWLNSGIDTWSWTNIDADCGVFTTQVNDAWFTPGQDGPVVREVYCRKAS